MGLTWAGGARETSPVGEASTDRKKKRRKEAAVFNRAEGCDHE
jgi:hypothetical protein